MPPFQTSLTTGGATASSHVRPVPAMARRNCLAAIWIALFLACAPLILAQESEELAPQAEEQLDEASEEDRPPEELVVETPASPSPEAQEEPTPRPTGPQIVTVPTRPGVTVRTVLITPPTAPTATLLLFPGGNGAGHFSERDGVVRLGGNFLVRSANHFVDHGFTVAIVDVPSDQQAGMSDEFRTSAAHVEDVRKLVDFVSEQAGGAVFLVGTSRGTVSVAHLAIALTDERVKAAVLSATLALRVQPRPGLVPVPSLPVERISLPVLFVHHRDDGCSATRYQDAVALRQRFTGSRRTDFVTVLGGDPPRSEPCEALSEHGFLGKEREVVAAISDWIRGGPVPLQIGP